MIILAIDLATPTGSIAILDDQRLIDEISWKGDQRSTQMAFDKLRELIGRSGINWSAIDVWTAGRGPGMYSGLRVVMTLIQAFALPGNKKVYSVSTGAVMAYDRLKRSEVDHVAVVGDARRDQIWYGLFSRSDVAGGVKMEKNWELLSLTDLVDRLPASTQLVSSDYSRLVGTAMPKGAQVLPWLKEDCFPNARALGELTYQKIAAEEPTEPLSPIYMRPAVMPPG